MLQSDAISRTETIMLDEIDLEDKTFMSRLSFDEEYIQRLAKDIETDKQRSPIGLKIREGRKYQILYGWNRVFAIQFLQGTFIDAHVYPEDLSELEAFKLNIADNAQHKSLSTLELALQIKKMIDDHGISVEDVARQYGRKKDWAYDLLTLTKMDEETQQSVHIGELGLSHAIQVSKFPLSERSEVRLRVVDEGLSVSALRAERKIDKQTQSSTVDMSLVELKAILFQLKKWNTPHTNSDETCKVLKEMKAIVEALIREMIGGGI